MYRDDVRRALESTSAEVKQDAFLARAGARQAALADLPKARDLLARLRDEAGPLDLKDELLGALIAEAQRGGPGAAFELLARAMFPVLDRHYVARTRSLPRDARDDVWSAVFAAFAEAVSAYPLLRRPARVAANLEGETLRALAAERRRESDTDRADDALARSAEAIPELGSVDPRVEPEDRVTWSDLGESGDSAPPREEEVVSVLERLDAEVARGALSEDDRKLILGVLVEGRTLGELAREIGIQREAAKKRYARARRRLRLGEEPRKRPACPQPDVDPDERSADAHVPEAPRPRR